MDAAGVDDQGNVCSLMSPSILKIAIVNLNAFVLICLLTLA